MAPLGEVAVNYPSGFITLIQSFVPQLEWFLFGGGGEVWNATFIYFKIEFAESSLGFFNFFLARHAFSVFQIEVEVSR